MNTMVFTGKPNYTRRKLRELHGRGWVIIRSRQWSDGSATYVMEYIGKK